MLWHISPTTLCQYVNVYMVAWHAFTLKSEYVFFTRPSVHCAFEFGEWNGVREISGGCHNSCPFIYTNSLAHGAHIMSTIYEMEPDDSALGSNVAIAGVDIILD